MIQRTSIFVLLLCFLVSYQSQAQADRDTLFYNIQSEMVGQASLKQSVIDRSEYFIFLELKEAYHQEFKELTGENVGNFLAIVYKRKVINSSLPTIQTAISGGQFQIGPYENKKKAEEIVKEVLKKD